jgi:hypothetical protein
MRLNVPGVVFLCLAATCAALSSLFVYQEIREVNRKSSDEGQISYWFMYPGKMQKIKAEYKRLYPTGRFDAWRITLQIVAFAFLAIAAIISGFFN